MKKLNPWTNEMKDLAFLIALILIITLCFMLNGCTYSVTLAHTNGTATDLIDENQKADADIKPNLTVPAI
jgi:hypothetical protein